MSSPTPEALRAFIKRCAADMREGASIWRADHDNEPKALVCEAHAAKFDAVLALLDAPPARDDAPAAGAQEPRCKATRTRARSSRCELVHGHAGAHKHRDWLWANDEPATPTPGAGGSR